MSKTRSGRVIVRNEDFELSQEKGAVRPEGKAILRTMAGFEFFQGDKHVLPLYESCTRKFWKGVEVEGYAASLSGEGRCAMQAGFWGTLPPGAHFECFRIKKILGMSLEKNQHWRGGKEYILWLETDQFSYALQFPAAEYADDWEDVIESWEVAMKQTAKFKPVNWKNKRPQWFDLSGEWNFVQKAMTASETKAAGSKRKETAPDASATAGASTSKRHKTSKAEANDRGGKKTKAAAKAIVKAKPPVKASGSANAKGKVNAKGKGKAVAEEKDEDEEEEEEDPAEEERPGEEEGTDKKQDNVPDVDQEGAADLGGKGMGTGEGEGTSGGKGEGGRGGDGNGGGEGEDGEAGKEPEDAHDRNTDNAGDRAKGAETGLQTGEELHGTEAETGKDRDDSTARPENKRNPEEVPTQHEPEPSSSAPGPSGSARTKPTPGRRPIPKLAIETDSSKTQLGNRPLPPLKRRPKTPRAPPPPPPPISVYHNQRMRVQKESDGQVPGTATQAAAAMPARPGPTAALEELSGIRSDEDEDEDRDGDKHEDEDEEKKDEQDKEPASSQPSIGADSNNYGSVRYPFTQRPKSLERILIDSPPAETDMDMSTPSPTNVPDLSLLVPSQLETFSLGLNPIDPSPPVASESNVLGDEATPTVEASATMETPLTSNSDRVKSLVDVDMLDARRGCAPVGDRLMID